MQYKVTFEIPTYITIFVDAKNEDEAKEYASEDLEVEEYMSKSGMGTTLAIKGSENKMFLDKDNCFERIQEVEEV